MEDAGRGLRHLGSGGFASALWPIILVIIAAIFTYNLSLKTGAMDVIKQMLTGVSADKRVLVLLIGWCFGGFMEGMAGFGTAIAIPASMLAGMGMNPITACLVCMLANAFPTAFGSVGIPTVTLANVTGLDPLPLAFTTVVQMVPFMILVPFLMVIVGGGGVKAATCLVLPRRVSKFFVVSAVCAPTIRMLPRPSSSPRGSNARRRASFL